MGPDVLKPGQYVLGIEHPENGRLRNGDIDKAVSAKKEKTRNGSALFADFRAGTDIVRLRAHTVRPYGNVIENLSG